MTGPRNIADILGYNDGFYLIGVIKAHAVTAFDYILKVAIYLRTARMVKLQ
jgi:hypothetical protein